jgi:hypothetical protein
VETQKIKFIRNRPWLTSDSPSKPVPVIKELPDWYRKADRYAINPSTEKPWEMPDGSGKIPTWKACPAIFDIMGSGYVYRTPCDIRVTEDINGIIHAEISDVNNKDFLQERTKMPQFVAPHGYHDKHYAWWADWAVELPEGYSALYTQPFNRYDLPFLTTSGIIDNDHVHLPGTMPFYLIKGFTGTIPAGTPYAQILPFKREHWESEVDASLTRDEMMRKNQENSAKYRKPDGGVYIKEVWERRKYE